MVSEKADATSSDNAHSGDRIPSSICCGQFTDVEREQRYQQQNIEALRRTTLYAMIGSAVLVCAASAIDFTRLPRTVLPMSLSLRAFIAAAVIVACMLVRRAATTRRLGWIYAWTMLIAVLAYSCIAVVFFENTGRSDYRTVLAFAGIALVVMHPWPSRGAWTQVAAVAIALVLIALRIGATPSELIWDVVTVLGTSSMGWVAHLTIGTRNRALFALNERLVSEEVQQRRITEADAKRARQALRKRDAELHAIMDSAQVSMALIDESGLLSFANGEASEFGLCEADSVFDWMSRLEDDIDSGVIDRAFTDGVRGEFEVCHEGRTLVFRVVPVGDCAPYEQVAMVGIDISETRRLNEELLQGQRQQAVGALAGSVAHDFNNLLTVVSGAAELMRMEEDLSGDRAAYVDQILDATTRATHLTRQLLHLSRAAPIRLEHTNLNEVLAQMTSLLERLIGSGIRLRVQLGDDVPAFVAGPGHVEQIIINLVINARDAMSSDGVIAVSTRACDGGAELAVADEGCGLSEEVRQRIFEPYFTTKGRQRGTGLGLATVRNVVEQLGGSIEVDSEVGVGTTFRVVFPATSETAAPTIRPQNCSGAGRSVLIVDDDEAVRVLAAKMLENAGYDVLIAKDRSDALACVSDRDRIDLLLIDLQLLRESGLDVAAAIRERIPRVAVVHMSGFVEDGVILDEIERSGGLLIDKPFTSRELLTMLERAYAGRTVSTA